MPQPSVSLTVRVTPRGGRDAVTGVRADGVLLMRVAASPVDGAANRACIALLSDFFGVPKSRITLVSGGTGREKGFIIEGVTDAIFEKLEGFTQ